jgi:hypothetical protein
MWALCPKCICNLPHADLVFGLELTFPMLVLLSVMFGAKGDGEVVGGLYA